LIDAGPVVPPPITDVVAPLGPNARAILEERQYPCAKCGVMRSKTEGGTIFTVCDECWPTQPSPRSTVANLLRDVAAGIRVLRDRDGLDVPEAVILERARNIVTGLIGNYTITGTGEWQS